MPREHQQRVLIFGIIASLDAARQPGLYRGCARRCCRRCRSSFSRPWPGAGVDGVPAVDPPRRPDLDAMVSSGLGCGQPPASSVTDDDHGGGPGQLTSAASGCHPAVHRVRRHRRHPMCCSPCSPSPPCSALPTRPTLCPRPMHLPCWAWPALDFLVTGLPIGLYTRPAGLGLHPRVHRGLEADPAHLGARSGARGRPNGHRAVPRPHDCRCSASSPTVAGPTEGFAVSLRRGPCWGRSRALKPPGARSAECSRTERPRRGPLPTPPAGKRAAGPDLGWTVSGSLVRPSCVSPDRWQPVHQAVSE